MFGFGEKGKEVDQPVEQEAKPVFEEVAEDDDGQLVRRKIPGGYIYRYNNYNGDDGMVFVPNGN